jgi:thymidine kinase
MPKCEKVKKLQAICKNCNHQASFHIRTAPKHITQMIGGEDMYKPVCRECYHKVAREIQEAEDFQERLRAAASKGLSRLQDDDKIMLNLR